MLLDHHTGSRDHHYSGSSRMGKTVTIDSDEESDPLTSRLLLNGGSKHRSDVISEYDSSESPSDRDEVLSSAGSDECDTISSNGGEYSNTNHHRNSHNYNVNHHNHMLNNNPDLININNSSSNCSDVYTSHQQVGTAAAALEIREVWAYNLYEEFMQICQLVQSYPFVAMDTEFPGIVAKPMGNFNTMDEYKYRLVKCNVDLLKMIQLGVTLFDAQGNRPEGVCTWQFNFKFSLGEDLYAEESIDLLKVSGIRFDQHCTEGIEPSEFAEMLLTSGLVLMDNVTWLTFHSAYDFGYLLSQLTCQQLPESETEFLETLRVYFPNMYDIKYLMSSIEHLNGGLQKVANELRVKRIGSQHQAGSDSLLTGQVFFKMYNEYFKEGLDDVKYNGFICGLGGACSVGTSSTSSTTTIITTNSITSTPSKSLGSHHNHQYLIEETCYDMEELRVNLTQSPARVH